MCPDWKIISKCAAEPQNEMEKEKKKRKKIFFSVSSSSFRHIITHRRCSRVYFLFSCFIRSMNFSTVITRADHLFHFDFVSFFFFLFRFLARSSLSYSHFHFVLRSMRVCITAIPSAAVVVAAAFHSDMFVYMRSHSFNLFESVKIECII